MKTNARCHLLCFAIIPTHLVAGAASSFDVPLSIPVLQTLQSTITATTKTATNSVTVDLRFVYSLNGQVVLTGDSTVDGTPITGRGTITKRGASTLYTIKATAAGRPRTSLTL